MQKGSRQDEVSLVIANIPIVFQIEDSHILFDNNSNSHAFKAQNTLSTYYKARIFNSSVNDFPEWDKVFTGKPWGKLLMDYQWYVYQNNKKIGIRIEYPNENDYNSIFAIIDFQSKQIEILIDSAQNEILFDPFQYPLGVLLYVYLVHHFGGLTIHASGVKDIDKGYLFTGLSGIGKSTMANLWKDKGALVINDDRLIIKPEGADFKMYNSPMPYYYDDAKEAELKKIFILKQSKKNYCKLLQGSFAYMGIMSNCIQHLHSSKMVQRHLDIIDNITKKVQVYELGFYPDSRIVDLIREMD